MSGVKSILKLAKVSLEQNDPEAALAHSKEVIKQDPKSYYAFVFQGKAYQLLNDLPKAITSFKKAIDIEPENLLAWKGYFQIAKGSNDYEQFFSVLTALARIYIEQGVPISELLRDMRTYLDTNEIKNNETLNEFYLRSILPGTELGELIGPSIESPSNTYKKLIDLKQTQTGKDMVARVSKERIKLGRVLNLEQKAKLDSIAWSYYSDNDLINLYDKFLNICDDEELRRTYHEKLLKFKYELLKICPDKEPLIKDIKQSLEDMIFLKTTSLFCWNLYFDWNDNKSINDLEEERVIEYLQLFQNEGLGLVLFGFVMSDISPYNKEKVIKALSGKEITPPRKSKEEGSLGLDELADDGDNDDEDSSHLYLPQEEVLGVLLDGFSKAKGSILANRIIVNYYIHLRQYHVASERCREGIKILADLQRNFGVDLKNTKEDLLCSLAIVYTYYEAPKNYTRAIQLYEKILMTNPDNVKAKVGKGLIYVERGELNEAKALLEEIVKDYPNNLEAESEYYWCLVKMDQHEEGREGLLKFLAKITGGDLHSRDVRAIAYWRLAKSYMDSSKYDECYKYLIESLKNSDLYAPSYTLLGVLLQNYYGDLKRGQKCFYKAFDLDPNEITAAKYLVEQATEKNEWEVANVLAKRVVDNESTRRLIMRGDTADPSWPYRVLGSGALNNQDDAKAVEWFQNALRTNAEDYNCWVGLGEAYFNCGRLDAAAKVFQHALDMNHDKDWTIHYMLGVVLCEMKDFNEGLGYLYSALEMQPNEECIISAIYEANIESSRKFLQSGFFGRAVNSILKALNFVKQGVEINKNSQKVWRALGDSLRVFIKIRERINDTPYDLLFEIFNNVDFINFEYPLDESISVSNARAKLDEGKDVESLVLLIILASAAALNNLPLKANKILKATSFYNLGLSLLESFQEIGNAEYRDLSVYYLKRAIKIEQNNAIYWIALGNAYFTTNPQISQHCYIKATTLEVKDAEIWVNLATLYLNFGDTQLSQETFLRAQSVAPQDAQSWLGNAVASEVLGDDEKASDQYIHAFTLSKGRSALASFLYGLSVVNRSKDRDPKDIETAQEFSISNQAMQQYLKYYPEDEAALSVGLSIAERCKDFETAVQLGTKLCLLYEKSYEETESEITLSKFADTKSQLARLHLGLGNYDSAIEEAKTALELDPDSVQIAVSVRITLGLAYFFTNKFQEAIGELKIVLSEYQDSSRIVALISQVLYAHDTEESRQAAIDQLFAHIEDHGSSLLIVLTLGAISLVEDLPEYLEAVKDDLLGLNLNEIVADTRREVPKLISEINDRLGKDEDKIWYRYAYMFPFSYHIWKHINSEMAKQVIISRNEKVTGNEYAEAMIKTGHLRDIQRGLMMNPCNEEAMKAIESCI
ncbi:SKI3 [Candida margitis]|uniref:SKI3 n=1 Tax=Candida margitis TaxID=1775924 RepID=UPI0022278C6A|nr:SKI3 [Candida margitis]KAI5968639.1 SKI3 [Candida margitis]